MKEAGHLASYDLILTTRAPLHIGSGAVCAKTDYLFDPRTETVSMIDPEALFAWLYEKRLADRYERFVLSGDTRLYQFLKDCRVTPEELDRLCLYRVSAADALDERHSLKEIHSFVRDSRRRVYVPGSSVKGALRTVILAALIAEEKKGTWPRSFNKNENARQMRTLEGEYLDTLALKRDKNGKILNDPVNSILRGLSISDSEPVSDESIILAGKFDVNERGEWNKINLCRECVRPGTELRFRLTLDRSALPADFTAEALMEMIRAFDTYYQKTYLARFTPPCDEAGVSWRDALILGGGAGYFSKTLTWPYLGVREGMEYTESVMRDQFRRHGHDKDISEHGVSPHMMKYARYQGKLYPYGVCGVRLA